MLLQGHFCSRFLQHKEASYIDEDSNHNVRTQYSGSPEFVWIKCFLPQLLLIVELTNEQIQRYGRHLILPEVGVEGQKKICATSVLCVGAGGLGSPVALYLAAAGICRLGIVDFDQVEGSNLQRQIIHGT